MYTQVVITCVCLKAQLMELGKSLKCKIYDKLPLRQSISNAPRSTPPLFSSGSLSEPRTMANQLISVQRAPESALIVELASGSFESAIHSLRTHRPCNCCGNTCL